MKENRIGSSVRVAVALACSVLGPCCAAAATYPRSYYEYYSADNPLFSIGDVDVKPVPRVRLPPRLPAELKDVTARVKVTVEYVISRNGATENIIVVKSTDRRFNDATIAAVKRWAFTPGMKAGKRVNCRVQQELMFN